MATCIQQINWHLPKADLEALLQEANGNYTALEFKMCVESTGNVMFYASLVAYSGVGTEATPRSVQKRVCPVPPGCTG